MIKIYVIIGSTRQKRFGDKPAKWIFEELKKQKGIAAELIDLRNWPLPFFDEPQSPMTSKGKYTLPLAAKWAEKVGEKTFPGFGIGLFISSEIIKHHNGNIWVESQKGKGSTFSFSNCIIEK